jgi:hypothetical protein
MLRQQLIVASRAVRGPKVRVHERALLVAIASLIPRWRGAMLLFRPETILRWHRQGFRLFWNFCSKAGKPPVHRIAKSQNVPLIDLTVTTWNWLQTITWQDYFALGTDHTHTNPKGAEAIAGFVRDAVKSQNIAFAEALR